MINDMTSQLTKEMIDQIAREAATQDAVMLRDAQLLYDNATSPQYPASMVAVSREYRDLAWTPVAICSTIVDKIASMLYGRTVRRTTGNEAYDLLLESGPWKQCPRLMLRTSKVASIVGFSVIRLRPIYPNTIAYADMGIGNASPILDPDDPHGDPIGMVYDYLEEPMMSQINRNMGGLSQLIHVKEVITRHVRDFEGNIVYPGIHGRLENGEMIDLGNGGYNLLGDYLDCVLWRGTDHPTDGCGRSDVLPILQSLTAANESMTDAHEGIIWNIWPMLVTDDVNADIRYSPRSVIKAGENAKGDPATVKRIEWSGAELDAWEVFYKRLITSIHESSRVPAIATGGNAEDIGNASSGRAFEIMMTPLLELTQEKETVAIEQEKDLMTTSIAMMAYYGIIKGLTSRDPITGIETPDMAKINKACEKASIEFAPVRLPKDKLVEAQIRSTLRMAQLESTEQAIRILHPDWNDDQIDDELKAVGADTPEVVNASASLRIKAAQEKLKQEAE